MHESTTPLAPPVDTAPGEPEQIAYTVPRAARLLDMGERKVWQLVHDGEMDSFTIGTARRVTRQAILDYIQRQGSAA